MDTGKQEIESWFNQDWEVNRIKVQRKLIYYFIKAKMSLIVNGTVILGIS